MHRSVERNLISIAAAGLIGAWVLAGGLLNSVNADSTEDLKALQGTWTAQKAELGGRVLSEAELGIVTLTIENDTYAVSVDGKPDKGTCQVEGSKGSGKMTITGGKDGPNAGKTFLAIYELNGDTLRICYDLSGKMTPTGFATQKGTPLYLVTYKRQQ